MIPLVLSIFHPHRKTQSTNSSPLLSIHLIQLNDKSTCSYLAIQGPNICSFAIINCVLQAGRKLVISPGSWLEYGADIHCEGKALLMKQHLQGFLLLQPCLTQAQPHHKTQMQTTGEFRLVTLAAMSFLCTALEGLSEAPSCTLTPGRTHG